MFGHETIRSPKINMLAVIIPYYKLTFFEATLNSLAAQKDQRFIVYIGDDASPENPAQLLEKYSGTFNFKYHRFLENLGGISLVQQWERCIALVEDEEWIMILGDDDVISANIVDEFNNNVDNELCKRIDVIRFASLKIDSNGDMISKVYDHPTLEKSSDFLFRRTRSSLSEYIFKADIIEKVGFKDFPLGWHSDVLAVLEFSRFDTILSINNAVVSVRISNQSISGSKKNLHLKDKASFLFYYYLVSKKSKFFSEEQNKKLFERLSKSYLNDKRNIMYFLKISSLYIYKFRWGQYFSFLKNIYFKLQKK